MNLKVMNVSVATAVMRPGHRNVTVVTLNMILNKLSGIT